MPRDRVPAAVAGLGDAALDGLEGAVQTHADPVLASNWRIGRNGEGAAAEGQHRGRPRSIQRTCCRRMSLSIGGRPAFAARGKRSPRWKSFRRLDLLVGIEEAPAEPSAKCFPLVLFPAPMKPTM
jgi:hypothetical protein